MEEAYRNATGNRDFILPPEEYEKFVYPNKIESGEKEKIKTILGKYYDELMDKADNESMKRKDELMDGCRQVLFIF